MIFALCQGLYYIATGAPQLQLSAVGVDSKLIEKISGLMTL